MKFKFQQHFKFKDNLNQDSLQTYIHAQQIKLDYIQQSLFTIMGNEQPKPNQTSIRRRSLPNRSVVEDSNRQNFATLNQSIDTPVITENRRYNSIDVTDDSRSAPVQRQIDKREAQQNQALQKLSKKNEQLRNQLKKISEELTTKLKKKKMIPKKNLQEDEDSESPTKQANQANAGLKRQLQNGYRQIQMYKRTIQSLKGKNEQHESDVRVKRIQNSVSSIDALIVDYTHKIEAVKKVKKVQDHVISKDINDDLIGGVEAIKREAESIKNTLKELTKKERQREVNYKKQQAYLFEVEKKWREVNGEYFPDIKNKKYQSNLPQINNRNGHPPEVLPKDFAQVMEELKLLKDQHDEYHRKIDLALQAKNKAVEQVNSLEQNVKYSDKVIEALRLKLAQMKKISKPARKSLFGYENSEGISSPSDEIGGIDEIEKQIQEQANQDQFDIKHLIANIPKPSRPKIVIDFKEDIRSSVQPVVARQNSAEKGGMIVSGQKSQPKKWGSSMTRKQEKGRGIRKQSIFQDIQQFPPQAKPFIVGVNIWLSKNNGILAIQAIYLNANEIRYGSKSANSDGFLQRYDLQNQDYLKNLTGAFSDEGYLQYLVLYSKQGKIGTFGYKRQGQDQFTFGLASSERPYRIYGASFVFDNEPKINRLGVEICQEG